MSSMPLPTALTFRGGASETVQIGKLPLKEALLAPVTDATSSHALPLASNGVAYAAYTFSNTGEVPVYFAFGSAVGITVDHANDACDGVLLPGLERPLATPATNSTHIAMITVSGVATVVVSPLA